jgi:hypothetical protein
MNREQTALPEQPVRKNETQVHLSPHIRSLFSLSPTY